MLVENQLSSSLEEQIDALMQKGLPRSKAVAILYSKNQFSLNSFDVSDLVSIRTEIKVEDVEIMKKEMISRGDVFFWINSVKESFSLFTKNGKEDPFLSFFLEGLNENLNKENDFAEVYISLLSVLIQNTLYRAKDDVEKFEKVLNNYFDKHISSLSFAEWKEMILGVEKFFNSSEFFLYRGFMGYKLKFIYEKFVNEAPHLKITAEESAWISRRFPQVKIDNAQIKT
ncbi:MAG: hypothetical protein PHG24_01780 [Candidatus Pacebacteria bacterium]|nr:hypothetical protein [Candidatus Paceibacterota bacterium]